MTGLRVAGAGGAEVGPVVGLAGDDDDEEEEEEEDELLLLLLHTRCRVTVPLPDSSFAELLLNTCLRV